MRLTFTSKKFSQELSRRRSEFKGKKLAARITMPEGKENRWWFYQEFGTATKFDANGKAIPGSTAPGGYDILPTDGTALKWTFPDGVTIIIPFVGFPLTRQHPGVTPKRFISKSEPEINRYAGEKISAALVKGGFDISSLREALMADIMPKAKSLIFEKMDELLPGQNPEGKLAGARASRVFLSSAQIVEVT